MDMANPVMIMDTVIQECSECLYDL